MGKTISQMLLCKRMVYTEDILLINNNTDHTIVLENVETYWDDSEPS
jgi:hypothetical protein